MTHLPSGKIFGGCRIVRLIARGASGAVYEAFQLSLTRPAALKVLAEDSASREEVEALLAEARTVAQVDHPNILRVFNAGTEEGRAFLLMELLEGQTLHERLRRSPLLPAEEALRISGEVARGLQAAHRAGVVHRDIKPSNIFLRKDGRPKLIDFGMSATSRHGGTPEFMAPEQWRRRPPDPRTDLYGLGLVLYRMLAGRNAFEGDLDRLRFAHLERPVPFPESVPIPERIFALIWKLVRKKVEERYFEASDFLSDLETVRAGHEPKSLAEMKKFVVCPTCDTESDAGAESCPECRTDLSWLHMTSDDLLPEPPKPKLRKRR